MNIFFSVMLVLSITMNGGFAIWFARILPWFISNKRKKDACFELGAIAFCLFQIAASAFSLGALWA